MVSLFTLVGYSEGLVLSSLSVTPYCDLRISFRSVTASAMLTKSEVVSGIISTVDHSASSRVMKVSSKSSNRFSGRSSVAFVSSPVSASVAALAVLVDVPVSSSVLPQAASGRIIRDASRAHRILLHCIRVPPESCLLYRAPAGSGMRNPPAPCVSVPDAPLTQCTQSYHIFTSKASLKCKFCVMGRQKSKRSV